MEMERGPLRLRRGERGRNLTPERGEEMAKVVNGVDVQALGQAVKGFQEKPDLGRFQFKVTNRWEEGGTAGRRSTNSTARERRIRRTHARST